MTARPWLPRGAVAPLAALLAACALCTAGAAAGGAAAGVESPFKEETKVPYLFGSTCGDQDGDATHMQLRQPGALLSVPGGVVVCDQSNSKLRFVRIASGSADGASKTLVAPQNVDMPAGVALGTDGSYFFTDLGNQQVKRWDAKTGVSVVAGHKSPQEARTQEGKGVMATMRAPYGIAADGGMDLFVSDMLDNRIRKVVRLTNVVSFWSGSGAAGFRDGPGGGAAFNHPMGVSLMGGSVYVADSRNHAVRAVSAGDGGVSTLAGSGARGRADGAGSAATFDTPVGLTSRDGWVFVAEHGGRAVRRILVKTRQVTTLRRFEVATPAGLALVQGPAGAGAVLAVSDVASCRVLSIEIPRGCDGVELSGKAMDRCGVCDGGDACLDCAGVPHGAAKKDRCGTCGGDGSGCRDAPQTGGRMPIDAAMVAREVARAPTTMLAAPPTASTPPHAPQAAAVPRAPLITVDTMVGRDSECAAGKKDGGGGAAPDPEELSGPMGAALSKDGTIYVADSGANVIRVLGGGSMKLLAGTGERGSRDGPGGEATFNAPAGLALGEGGALLVADSGSGAVRSVSPEGVVSTLRLRGAALQSPRGIAVGSEGTVYVADAGLGAVVAVKAGGDAAPVGPAGKGLLGRPRGVAVDGAGRLVVADLDGRVLRLEGGGWRALMSKGQPVHASYAASGKGEGAGVRVKSPAGVAVGPHGEVFVADSSARAVYALAPEEGAMPTLLAGDGAEGTRDGKGTQARFREPYSLFSDQRRGDLHLLVADRGACSVRRLTRLEAPPPLAPGGGGGGGDKHTHLERDGTAVEHSHPGAGEPHHHAPDGRMIVGSEEAPPGGGGEGGDRAREADEYVAAAVGGKGGGKNHQLEKKKHHHHHRKGHDDDDDDDDDDGEESEGDDDDDDDEAGGPGGGGDGPEHDRDENIDHEARLKGGGGKGGPEWQPPAGPYAGRAVWKQYTAQRGDTMRSVAAKLGGVSAEALRKANKKLTGARERDGTLREGTVLVVPPKGWSERDVGDEEQMEGMSERDRALYEEALREKEEEEGGAEDVAGRAGRTKGKKKQKEKRERKFRDFGNNGDNNGGHDSDGDDDEGAGRGERDEGEERDRHHMDGGHSDGDDDDGSRHQREHIGKGHKKRKKHDDDHHDDDDDGRKYGQRGKVMWSRSKSTLMDSMWLAGMLFLGSVFFCSFGTWWGRRGAALVFGSGRDGRRRQERGPNYEMVPQAVA